MKQTHLAGRTKGLRPSQVRQAERLDLELNEFLSRFELTAENIHRPRPHDPMEHFDRESLDLVNSVYARDFDILGYEKV